MVQLAYRRACHHLSAACLYCQPRRDSNTLPQCSAYAIYNSTFLSSPPSSTYIFHEISYNFIKFIYMFYINQVVYKNDLWANTTYLKPGCVPILYLPQHPVCS